MGCKFPPQSPPQHHVPPVNDDNKQKTMKVSTLVVILTTTMSNDANVSGWMPWIYSQKLKIQLSIQLGMVT